MLTQEQAQENLECKLCGIKLKPNYWIKCKGFYFCSLKHMRQYTDKKR